MIKKFIPLSWLPHRVTRHRREKLLVKYLIILRLDTFFVWVGGKRLGFFSSHPKGTEGNIHKISSERIQRCQKLPFFPLFLSPSHFLWQVKNNTINLKRNKLPNEHTQGKKKKFEIQDSPLHNNESVDHIFLFIFCFL